MGERAVVRPASPVIGPLCGFFRSSRSRAIPLGIAVGAITPVVPVGSGGLFKSLVGVADDEGCTNVRPRGLFVSPRGRARGALFRRLPAFYPAGSGVEVADGERRGNQVNRLANGRRRATRSAGRKTTCKREARRDVPSVLCAKQSAPVHAKPTSRRSTRTESLNRAFPPSRTLRVRGRASRNAVRKQDLTGGITCNAGTTRVSRSSKS